MPNGPDDKARQRRTYGRGFHDGWRAALEGQTLTTPSRLESLERGLNGTAQKVLAEMPDGQPIAATELLNSLRTKGVNIVLSAVSGCLNHFREVGLAKEVEDGRFVRVNKKARVVLVPPAVGASVVPPETEPTRKQTAIEIVAALAKRANDLAECLRSLAIDIEAVAVEVDEQVKDAGRGSEKLRQLQALLKSIE